MYPANTPHYRQWGWAFRHVEATEKPQMSVLQRRRHWVYYHYWNPTIYLVGGWPTPLKNPPAPKVLGRDRPDGTRKRLQVYLGGGAFFGQNLLFFDRSWRSPSKNTVKNSTEDTCSWTRPSKIGKRKVKKTRVFQLFDLNFLVCNIFFCGSAGGLARRRIFEFLDPFSDWFASFCDSRNTGFYSVFLFSACLTASFKTSKNLVNYAVLCYGVNENIVNTSVFWRWLKNTVNYSVFGHLTLKNHGICSGFCFSPRKNTVNNSNFAAFPCFSLFFELRWSAIHGYQILRVFFPDNQYFRMFLVSMADIIGSYDIRPKSSIRPGLSIENAHGDDWGSLMTW